MKKFKLLTSLILVLSMLFSSVMAISVNADANAPNVYVGWTLPSGGADILTVDFRVTTDCPSTYWSVAQFNDGYMGFQTLGNGSHAIIMSFWDLNNGIRPKAEYAKYTDVSGFGGEGTGQKILSPYNWEVGAWYTMRIQIRHETGKSVYEQWIKPEDGEWDRVGEMSYAIENRTFTYWNFFQEDFWTSADKTRAAELKNSYARSNNTKEWMSCDKYKMSYNPHPNNASDKRADWGVTTDGSAVYLSAGGTTASNTTGSQTLTINQNALPVFTEYLKEGSISPSTCTATFDSKGGSSVASQTVTSGSLLSKPSNPSKTGYTFDGWYIDDGIWTNQWDFAIDTIPYSLTLYSKWVGVPSTETYTVTFNSDGGTSYPPQTVNAGSKLTAVTDPVKNGYKFEGWYFNQDDSLEAWDFTTNIVTESGVMYAKWTEITNPDLGKNAPNVYVGWTLPSGGADILTVDFRVTTDCPSTYWAVAQFNDGYMGFQTLGDGSHAIIMSFWDLDDGTKPTAEYGKYSSGLDFGGEGTGKKILSSYDWEVGAWYTMRIQIRHETDKSVYEQWIKSEDGDWELIAEISYPIENRTFTYWNFFQEDFWESAGKVRAAELKNAYARSNSTKEWTSCNKYKMSYNPHPNNPYDTRANWGITDDSSSVYLSAGGTTSANTTGSQTLTINQNALPVFTEYLTEEDISVFLSPDGDEVFDIKDLVYLKRMFCGWQGCSDNGTCDINADGDVNVVDLTYLKRYIAYWVGYETLPITKTFGI